jgi:prepilin-type N-terminal cleavage/methylation domain-containing protein/prepilin-type processing-associated H-X9-DG protein
VTGAPQHEPAGSRARRAFTLVEMLVAISVCAVLAALILSAGWYARQRARVFQCTVNLQQLGVAIALYVNDYQAIPLVYPDVQPGVNGPKSRNPGGPNGPIVPPEPPGWFAASVVLGDYVSAQDTFVCPVARALYPRDPNARAGLKLWDAPYDNDLARYWFNEHASGLKMTQVHAPPSKSLMMFDPLDPRLGWPHLRRYNALFLDGHVRGYGWVYAWSPYATNADWPPD